MMDMGQTVARKYQDQGMKLYQLQQPDRATRKWEKALGRMKGRRERFDVYGLMARAYRDMGKLREMLACSVRQVGRLGCGWPPLCFFHSSVNIFFHT